MKLYRLTIYFVLTALISITAALLVVNAVIGGLAEAKLVQLAERNAIKTSVHLMEMLTEHSLEEHHHPTDAVDGIVLADTEKLHAPAGIAPMTLPTSSELKTTPAAYNHLFHDLDIVGIELLDLQHNTLWEAGYQYDHDSPENLTQTGSPSSGSSAEESSNPLYAAAAHGEVASKLVRKASSDLAEPDQFAIDLVDVYLPIHDAQTHAVTGIMELSYDVTDDVALQVDEVRKSVLRVTVGTLSALFFILLGFMVVAETSVQRSRRREMTLMLSRLEERQVAEVKLMASLEEKGVLLKEVHHRVKNNMQLISSLLSLQSGYVKDEASALAMKESQYRIKAMALVHEKLYRTEGLSLVDFSGYSQSLVDGLLRSYVTDSVEITPVLKIQKTALDVDSAVSCGLILNELVSNSLKHAFNGRDHGEILVELTQKSSNWLTLKVSDDGVGFPADLDFRQTESLGLQLVTMLVDQLEGEIELDNSNGSTFQIQFPNNPN